MKKLIFVSAAILGILFTSCSEDQETPSTLVETLDIDSEATFDSNYEDVDQIAEASLNTVDQNARGDRDEIIACANVTHDRENKSIVIDYGEGCVGPGGRTRAGIIRVSYSDHRLVPGAFRTTTFEGFSLDGVLMEGTRTVENISESLEDDLTFSISLTGGRMTFEDGTSSTRESQRTRTWIRASNPLDDQRIVTGFANGNERDGTAYSVEITSSIVYKRACWASRVFIPVSGVKQYTSGDDVAVVDYGDGTCDNEVSISINGGEPIIKEIQPRGRRQ
ncbi:MAG: hypothetical protein HRT61_15320 [Ekhidna sp.]|nr:hypothetical protein [Ekhidna sp.]